MDDERRKDDEKREKLRTEMLNNGQVKRISAKEFRDEGYLQEVNRMFLHPLGLALEVVTDENEVVDFGGVWDYRDDPEGMRYDIANRSEEQQKEMKDKALNVQNQIIDKMKKRMNMFGGVVMEPIPGMPVGQ